MFKIKQIEYILENNNTFSKEEARILLFYIIQNKLL